MHWFVLSVLHTLSSPTAQSFVNVLPEQNSEIPSTLTLAQRVHIYTSVGGSVSNSALCGGVLVDSHFTQQLTRKEEESSSSLLVKKDKNGNILTAVFGISLSGKGDESGNHSQMVVHMSLLLCITILEFDSCFFRLVGWSAA